MLLASAISGAASGAYGLGALDDPPGKTLLGALLGGTVGVELFKWAMGIQRRTGDVYAVPMSIGIAIGRLGCWFTGLEDHTHGLPTHVPWAWDYGDGIPRHPAQLYEIAFALSLAWVLRRRRAWMQEGDLFRCFLIAYCAWRVLIDFLKPGTTYGGLTPIQWTAAAASLYYASELGRRVWGRAADVG